jgi:LAO/AO transport system kinase
MSDLGRHPDAFIRPSPGGGQLGGVARRTREAMLLCEAFGFDVIVIETIGVGQSEVAVAEMVDLFLLLVNPGGGDELQGIKRGIMELADIVAVNKADGDLAAAARRTAADYARAMHLMRPQWKAWTPLALQCSALEGTGIDEIWDAILAFHEAVTGTGELDAARADQSTRWLWSEIRDELLNRFNGSARVSALLDETQRAVAEGELSPAAGARRLLDAFEGEGEG